MTEATSMVAGRIKFWLQRLFQLSKKKIRSWRDTLEEGNRELGRRGWGGRVIKKTIWCCYWIQRQPSVHTRNSKFNKQLQSCESLQLLLWHKPRSFQNPIVWSTVRDQSRSARSTEETEENAIWYPNASSAPFFSQETSSKATFDHDQPYPQSFPPEYYSSPSGEVFFSSEVKVFLYYNRS